MHPDRLPRPLRIALYAGAVGVLTFLCLAPAHELPKVNVWDKSEHAVAWMVLAGLGLILAPVRPRAIAAFAVLFGAAIEVLQATMGFGRQGDWRDFAADSLGVAAAFAIAAALRRLKAARSTRAGAGPIVRRPAGE